MTTTQELIEARRLAAWISVYYDPHDAPKEILAVSTLLRKQADALEGLQAEVAGLRAERDCAVNMLAEWCVAVDTGGSGWDYWDEYYKNAMYRLNPIRELLDVAIAAQGRQE